MIRMKIGSHKLSNNLVLAPMAGITDRPFRQLCSTHGAGMTVSEMIISNRALLRSRKTRLRLDHDGEASPVVVQIVGADPGKMADGARYNADHGADIIDINMGCPARKVCNARAGSALMSDIKLAGKLLESVVAAVDIPVTLKIRTGPDPDNRNAVAVAQLAEGTGIQALTVHGRTRTCGFKGVAEHTTVRRIKKLVSIPVIANGDICTPHDAARVLQYSAADGIMIGRAARGNPWLFREISYYLDTGDILPRPSGAEIGKTLISHLHDLYDFYGDYTGVRIARKHIAWFCRQRQDLRSFLALVNRAQRCEQQLQMIINFFDLNIEPDKAA